jgi:hypothetical protein
MNKTSWNSANFVCWLLKMLLKRLNQYLSSWMKTKWHTFRLVVLISLNIKNDFRDFHKRAIKENNDIIVKSDCSKALKNDTVANIVFL